MLNNTHFAIAIHVMTALAYNWGKTVPSEALAETVGTNASFLRKLIGKLAAAGLVSTQLGKGGGTTLTSEPDKITLLDIYRATSSPEMIAQHACHPRRQCAIADAVPNILGDVDNQLRRAVETELAHTQLSTLVARYVES